LLPCLAILAGSLVVVTNNHVVRVQDQVVERVEVDE
jgi:hypothetical protein